MDSVNHLIFLGGFLVALSILAGMLSSRLGAPLLLVFLGLGMLAGEDGPGGIVFDDFRATYLVGSVALAIILFDGGLRTPRAAFKIALWPALSLATIGVLATAIIAGAAAVWAMEMSAREGFLVGATVASTDAAAVFLLLHARGTELNRRVGATLEIESGVNDPMAVFLTIVAVDFVLQPELPLSWPLAAQFVVQMGGGGAIGLAGGVLLLALINRVEIAPGLYPILAASLALVIFAGAHMVGASGFLAVYLAGLVLGHRRHRAQQVILRFHDGLAWLAQIVMFLLLGLLVTPRELVPTLGGELAVAAALIVVARPVAVWLSLLPFRFTWREQAFVAWVGLRGAVPIFLASIPVIADVPRGMTYFHIAFVVVLASLVVQGWTVTQAARLLGLELPPRPEPLERHEIDLPPSADREAGSWRVEPGSPALATPFKALALPWRTRIIAVIRDGAVMDRRTLDRLTASDHVIALAPPQHLWSLDKLFAARPVQGSAPSEIGDFVFSAEVRLGELGGHYGVPVESGDRKKTLGEFLLARLGSAVVVGDRVSIGGVDLIVREIDNERIVTVGFDVEPQAERLPLLRLLHRLFGRG
ncbi:MAG: potassium/proton antiporter [Pseudomonadota bacterium]